MILPSELIAFLMVSLDGDITTLAACAVVCHAFHNAATPLLYKRIHVSPPKVGLAWQIVEDTLGRKPFAASRLPTHVGFVEEFTLDGYLTKIRPSRQTPVPIIDKIPQALQIWPNLKKVTLTPQIATGPALIHIVRALRMCLSLRAVIVNEFAMEEEVMPELAQLTTLHELTLIHPTRALFMVLCQWLSNMRGTLRSLHLLGNCGSLTPGILRMITPLISNIDSLAIGLSYSLTDADIFVCLSQLPELESLRLRYYHQHGSLLPGPVIPSLRYLTVLHTPLSGKQEADSLSAWIRRVTSSSPLKKLQAICPDDTSPSLCFDGLVTHIASRHQLTLSSLSMPKIYVRGPALETLLKKCVALRDIALTISFSTLKAFPTMADRCTTLETVSFYICDHPKLIVEKKHAEKILRRVSRLRSMKINKVLWKGEWVAQQKDDGPSTPEFVVSLASDVSADKPIDDTFI